jgi:hypothetical protein
MNNIHIYNINMDNMYVDNIHVDNIHVNNIHGQYIYIDIVGAKEVTLQHTVYFIYYANTNANTTNNT